MARVLVVGGGIAGLWTAVKAADAGHAVELVTKTELADGNTRHAQGGIAAALFPDDSVERHFADTIAAGAGPLRPRRRAGALRRGSRRACATSSASASRSTAATPGSSAGSRRRTRAPASCTRAAMPPARRSRRRSSPPCGAVRCAIARAHDARRPARRGTARWSAHGCSTASGDVVDVRADAVVLATGGSGCLYRHTTNPDVATGDGVAAAQRAGARVADLEFVQFHPTALAAPGHAAHLRGRARRGRGAASTSSASASCSTSTRAAELAPRDVVARAVWRRMAEQGGRARVPRRHRRSAPRSSRGASRASTPRAVRPGTTGRREPVPITPAAHYAMGGVVTDLDGRTTPARASSPWARPHAPACTAPTGSRRTPCSRRPCSPTVRRARSTPPADPRRIRSVAATSSAPAAGTPARRAARRRRRRRVGEFLPASVGARDRRRPRGAAGAHVGARRARARRDRASPRHPLGSRRWRAPDVRDRRTAEDRNLLDLARLTVAAALARPESVGAHFRSDDPDRTRRGTSGRARRRAPTRRLGGRLMTDRREIDRIVGAALDEDAPWGDLTSETLIPADATATAELVAREAGVLSGIEVFAAAFRLVDPRIARRARSPPTATRSTPGDALARVHGPARGILHGRARRPEPRAAHVGRRHAHRAVRRRGGGHARAHRRHPQDDAGAAQPRAAGRARRRRPQPPTLALRRGDGEGQPPRRAHRGRAGPRDRAARRTRADAAHRPPRGRGRPARPGRRGARRRRRHDHARQLLRRRPAARASSSSPGAPWSRHRAGSRSTPSARSPRPGVDVISVGALTHSARALDLGLDVVVVDGCGRSA